MLDDEMNPIRRAALKAWCDGYNAGQRDARDNVYWRRWRRYMNYWVRGFVDPAWRHERWRWWKFWPDRS
jgi:2-polyprenyl-6-methoxyphenol hydroxylase-like FAD-dependent oxidoreductase